MKNVTKSGVIEDIMLVQNLANSIETNVNAGELMKASVTCASFKAAANRITRHVDALLKEAQEQKAKAFLSNLS